MDDAAPPPDWSTPGPPRRRPASLITMVAAVAVLVIVGAVVTVLVGRGDDKRHPVAEPTTPYVRPLPAVTFTPTPTPSGPFKSTVVGWQVIVASKKNGLSYDVPADWKGNGGDTAIGLADGSRHPDTTVTFSAESEKNRCVLGGAGFAATGVDDLRSSATQVAQRWAAAAAYKAGSPQKTIGSPENIRLKGLNQAVQITARVGHAPDSDRCGSTGTIIRIVALPVRATGRCPSSCMSTPASLAR